MNEQTYFEQFVGDDYIPGYGLISTDNAVAIRVTHKPSGFRSQCLWLATKEQNRDRAIDIIKANLALWRPGQYETFTEEDFLIEEIRANA